MTTASWFIVSLVFFGSVLLVYGFSLVFPTQHTKKTKSHTKQSQKASGNVTICPMCASPLYPGEQLKSAVFPGSSDRMCHIFGCPNCYPFTKDTVERICPVCHHEVPAEGYLIARMFNRKDTKKHVHITGCTVCKKIHK